MLSAYPACFFKEETGYSVVFPDLNWLSTCGDTMEEALSMAVDCLAGYLYSLQRENEDFPVSSDIREIDIVSIMQELEIDTDEAFINMITVDVTEYAKTHFEKSVKKTLTIPAWLNTAALKNNINFSQTLQEALLQKINQ